MVLLDISVVDPTLLPYFFLFNKSNRHLCSQTGNEAKLMFGGLEQKPEVQANLEKSALFSYQVFKM